MLLKIYQTTRMFLQEGKSGEASWENEELHIIDNAHDVVVHQGNYGLPEKDNAPGYNFQGWGPAPQYLPDADVKMYGHPSDTNGATVRVIDYTKDGIRHRALVSKLCYVCNDQGKTIERIECYSGARLSVA